MCGIVGFQGDFNLENLNIALKKIHHRGPDNSSIYSDIAYKTHLGHARLAIQDISNNGNQPMISENKKYVIIFNGEIYNFLTLKKDLLKKGHSFKSKTDTEVILHLYIKHGENFVKLLNGIFTICIYNKIDNSLNIYRDPFGVKPLYYFYCPKGFGFASEIKSIVEIINAEKLKDINYESVYYYLKYLWSPLENTPFKNIIKFLPGYMMKIENGKITKYLKWKKVIPIKETFKSVRLVKQNLFSKISNAVEKQMISDVPLGAFLSGGLDSSTIAYFAKKHNPDINFFTINIVGDDNFSFNEDIYYSKYLSKKLDLNLNIINVDSKNISNDISEMVYNLEEPIADPSALHVDYITKLARDSGIKVMLSGTGGDDILTGYNRHKAIKLYDYMDRIPNRLNKLFANLIFKLNNQKLNKFFSSYDRVKDNQLNNLFSWIDSEQLLSLFNTDIKLKLKPLLKVNPLNSYLNDNFSENLSQLSKLLLLEQRFFLSEHNLIYNDKMSMKNSVEIRVPFLDDDLVEYCAKIENSLKIKYLNTKWILKKTMENHLPNKIIYRKKVGFGAPIRTWIKKDLRNLVHEMLSEKNIKKRGIFNYQSIKNLIESNEKGEIDASYTIFSLINLEIWFKKYYDKKHLVL